MLAILERFGIFARAPDARPRADIAADIDAELAFHLEESARELEQTGLAPDAARAEARRRFGDTEQVRRDCARTQLGERFMVQRLHFLLTGLLIAMVGFLWLGTRRAQAEIEAHRSANQELLHRLEAEAARLASLSGAVSLESSAETAPGAGPYKAPDGRAMDLSSAAARWLATYRQTDTWRHGLRITYELAALPDKQSVEILAVIWPSLVVAHREQAFKPFVFEGGTPLALEVIDLGLRDPAPSVRNRALSYLPPYAWRDLSIGDGAAESWMAEWRDKPVAEVILANASRWVRELGDMLASYDRVPAELMEPHLKIVNRFVVTTLAKHGVDLEPVLREADVCERLPKALDLCDTATRLQADKVLNLCTPR